MMSEKRFVNFYEDGKIVGVADDNDTWLCENGSIMELLNALHEENERLKHYKLYQDNKRLQTIIADLKEANRELNDEVNDYIKLYKSSIAENEQLEQKIKDKNEYQRVLEAKIRRLKDRIKILEKAEGWQN